MSNGQGPVYISVDVETAGPNPGTYSLLSIGACLVEDPAQGFYVELRPVNAAADDAALAVSGLSMEKLVREGFDPAEAMALFEHWVSDVVPGGAEPLLVAFNAPFDWMFINDYFYRFLGRNPFGHAALDIKAFYMGMSGLPWKETSMRYLGPRYLAGRALSHNALSDARDQAELFTRLLAQKDEPQESKI